MLPCGRLFVKCCVCFYNTIACHYHKKILASQFLFVKFNCILPPFHPHFVSDENIYLESDNIFERRYLYQVAIKY
jgi:hypothetical protein